MTNLCMIQNFYVSSFKKYIYAVVIEDTIYYVLRSIADTLGYTSPSSLTSLLKMSQDRIYNLDDVYVSFHLASMDSYGYDFYESSAFKKDLLYQLLSHNPSMSDYNIKFTDKEGLKFILSRTQKLPYESLLDLCSVLSIDCTILKPERSELSFGTLLDEMLSIYPELHLERQMRIGNYRADFVIPYLNLIIEYDENNHAYYDSTQEKEREKFLRNQGYEIFRVSDDVPIQRAVRDTMKFIKNVMNT